MRQGRASGSSGAGVRKVEPRPHAQIVAGVAQLGQAQGDHITEAGATGYHGVSRGGGRGFMAPHDDGRTVHRSGSQGKR